MKINHEEIKHNLLHALQNTPWQTASLRQLASGRDNIVFKDEKQTVVIKISLTKSILDVEQEAALMRYLKARTFPVSNILKLGTCEYQGALYPYVVTSFIPHDHLSTDLLPSKALLADAAKALAELHAVTATYESSYLQERRLDSDIQRLLEHLDEGKSRASNTSQLIRDLEWAVQFFEAQGNSVDCIIHNDYRMANVLFKNGKLAGVIDFEWAITSPSRLKDVGQAALEWSFIDGKSMDNERYHAFINAYAGQSSVKVDREVVKEWSKFAALADAAYYFLSFPERTLEMFDSYMYEKYKYLAENEV